MLSDNQDDVINTDNNKHQDLDLQAKLDLIDERLWNQAFDRKMDVEGLIELMHYVVLIPGMQTRLNNEYIALRALFTEIIDKAKGSISEAIEQRDLDEIELYQALIEQTYEFEMLMTHIIIDDDSVVLNEDEYFELMSQKGHQLSIFDDFLVTNEESFEIVNTQSDDTGYGFD